MKVVDNSGKNLIANRKEVIKKILMLLLTKSIDSPEVEDLINSIDGSPFDSMPFHFEQIDLEDLLSELSDSIEDNVSSLIEGNNNLRPEQVTRLRRGLNEIFSSWRQLEVPEEKTKVADIKAVIGLKADGINAEIKKIVEGQSPLFCFTHEDFAYFVADFRNYLKDTVSSLIDKEVCISRNQKEILKDDLDVFFEEWLIEGELEPGIDFEKLFKETLADFKKKMESYAFDQMPKDVIEKLIPAGFKSAIIASFEELLQDRFGRILANLSSDDRLKTTVAICAETERKVDEVFKDFGLEKS
jgi:hypothetical protein